MDVITHTLAIIAISIKIPVLAVITPLIMDIEQLHTTVDNLFAMRFDFSITDSLFAACFVEYLAEDVDNLFKFVWSQEVVFATMQA